jgi:hypothetical protein
MMAPDGCDRDREGFIADNDFILGQNRFWRAAALALPAALAAKWHLKNTHGSIF